MALTARATHVLQWRDKGANPRGANPKSRSQSGLESATRLHEVGIASNREISIAAVNTFPGLVHTARHTMGVGCTRSGSLTAREGALPRWLNDWGEVVTR